ncbi:transcriptional regulator, TetR family [Sphingobium sp. AP50]|uniref:TetR/AcrR family transcriptional regulator n=1 Tax=Sphingobium sp. AP50 TaxID=1884369 RepID=UPI0008D57F29|nr:TetR/AcrR family transcriptional regulator [Sphingobium sp. AP50]SEK00807.1 transcriptional regulator, TetR family [Sphingobium sp. AP50]
MAQVKKDDMRNAILAAAFDLFSERGYASTTVSAIARAASMTVANLYVYFPSKIVLLYAVYRPWLLAKLEEAELTVMRYRTPETRLRRLILALWRDIPSTDHGMANALVEALATTPPDDKKPNDLLLSVEDYLTNLLVQILPKTRCPLVEDGLISHMMWMAFDGFAINRRLGDVRDMDRLTDHWIAMLLGDPVEP